MFQWFQKSFVKLERNKMEFEKILIPHPKNGSMIYPHIYLEYMYINGKSDYIY